MEYREQVGENEKFKRSLQSVSTQAFLEAVPGDGRWRAVLARCEHTRTRRHRPTIPA